MKLMANLNKTPRWEVTANVVRVIGWFAVLGAWLFFIMNAGSAYSSFEESSAFILPVTIVFAIFVHFTCKELIGAVRDNEGSVAHSILVAMILAAFVIWVWIVIMLLRHW